MNYNKFRIWAGRIFGVLLLGFAHENFNVYALSILAVGALIRIWAAGYIHKDKEVTMAGPYKLLRHPLYLGNFLLGLGFVLFINVWQLAALYIPIFLIVYYKKMQLEEAFLSNEFTNYFTYKQITPRFIPKLSNIFNVDNAKFNWRNVLTNREHLNVLGILIVVSFFVIYQSHSNLLKSAVLQLAYITLP